VGEVVTESKPGVITAQSRPKPPPALYVAQRDGQYLFLEPAAPSWIVANGNGAYVLKLCDGTLSVSDIFGILHRQGFSGQIASLLKFFEIAYKKGVIQVGVAESGGSGSASRPSRKTMIEGVRLYVTEACNLACRYCLANAHPGRPSSDQFRVSDIERLLVELEEFKDGEVNFSIFGGEPLLRPDVLDMARAIKRHGHSVDITTNGTLIDEDNAAAIASAFDQVVISIDGTTPQHHDPMRGKGTHKSAEQAIRLIAAAGGNVRVSLVISRQNIDNVLDWMEKYAEFHQQVFPLSPVGRGNRCHAAMITPQEFFEVMYENRKRFPAAKFGGERLKKILDKREADPMMCISGNGTFSVAANGDVFPCQLLHDPRFAGGNIKTTPLKDILASRTLRSVADVGMDDVTGCRECPVRMLCGAGCRATSILRSGDVTAKSDLCEFYRLNAIAALFDTAELTVIHDD